MAWVTSSTARKAISSKAATSCYGSAPFRLICRISTAAVVSRLKVLAGMNLAEHRAAQDGRATLVVAQRAVDPSLLPAAREAVGSAGLRSPGTGCAGTQFSWTPEAERHDAPRTGCGDCRHIRPGADTRRATARTSTPTQTAAPTRLDVENVTTRITVRKLAECIGGPLDGCQTAADEWAFPWPCGWYYLVPATMTFRWDGNPDHFIESDAQLHARDRRVVWGLK